MSEDDGQKSEYLCMHRYYFDVNNNKNKNT
jgi:hypothetical protein